MSVKQIKVPGMTTTGAYGGSVTVFTKGVDVYEENYENSGQEIELLGEGDVVLKGTLQGLQVGALIDLIGPYAGQSIHTYGRPYSNLAFIRALSKAQDETPLDTAKLYTVMTVSVNMPSPGMGV